MKDYNKIRVKALFIDLIIIAIIWIILFAIFIYISSSYSNYNISAALFLGLFLCKDNLYGQSFGKRICKLKVVDNKGLNLNIIKLTARNFFLFLGPIEFVLLMYYEKRIGDKVFDTKVIFAEKSDKITFKSILIYLFSLIFTILFFLPLVGF